MPVSYQFESRLLIVTAVGAHTFDDVTRTIRQALDDPRFAPGMGLLVDARRGEVTASGDDVMTHVSILESMQDRLSKHCAIVVTRSVDFGTGRMFVIYSEWQGLNVRLYRDFDAAKQWLEGRMKE